MKPFYAFGRAVVSLILRLGGVRIMGSERIPENEALLIVSNHVSFGDPPAITMAFPRQITYIAKEAFGRQALTRWLFGKLGAVFLDKNANDLAAMRACLKELRAGRSVAVFPEGTRHFDQQLGDFMPGAAYIALRAGVRVLPMALINTGDFWRIWRRNIIVNIGEPLDIPTGLKPNDEALNEQTERFRRSIAALLDESVAILQAEKRKFRNAR